MKRLVITVLFVIATMLAAAGIFSNYDKRIAAWCDENAR